MVVVYSDNLVFFYPLVVVNHCKIICFFFSRKKYNTSFLMFVRNIVYKIIHVIFIICVLLLFYSMMLYLIYYTYISENCVIQF